MKRLKTYRVRGADGLVHFRASRVHEGNSAGLWEIESDGPDGRSWELVESRRLALTLLADERQMARRRRQAQSGPGRLQAGFVHRDRR